ncbi:MAG: hypothetical protein E7225_00960 [Clostridiales bacterium]|nr:hypothetical protein [Clostridiales bacterium]
MFRYVILALLAVMVIGVGYIYIESAPGGTLGRKNKKNNDPVWSPVDEFLAEPEPVINDEPKVISIEDFEAEKERRNKKKD